MTPATFPANTHGVAPNHGASSTPASGSPKRQGSLNQERVEVTALSGNDIEILVAANEGPSAIPLPRRSEIAVDPASHDEIMEISHAESDPERLMPQASTSHLSSPENASGSKANPLSFLAKTDAAAAVRLFQNKPYLVQERQAANLPRFKESVGALHAAIQNPAVPKKERDELSRLTLDLMHKIDRVSTDKSQGRKLAMKLFLSMASIGMCMLPLLTAHKNKDNQYFSLLIAGYAKTMLMLTGLALNRTTDAKSFATHFKERHVPYLIPTLPYSVSAYSSHAKEFEHKHPIAFHGTAAAFTGAMFLLSSAPHLVTGPLNKMHNKVKDYLTSDHDAATDAGRDALSAEFKEEIGNLTDAFRVQHEAMKQRRDEFEKDGNQLSDVLNSQVSAIDLAAMKLDNSLKKLLGTESENPGAIVRGNEDLPQKAALTVLAAALCLGSAATYYDEPVGLVDLGMDAGLTIGEMTRTALNPAATAQRAVEKFASYSGLAPFLLVFGLINKIPKKHFTDSVAGLAVGSILLTCANATLSRPGAEALSHMMVNLVDSIKKARGTRPDVEQGASAQGNSGVTIIELTDGGDEMQTAGGEIPATAQSSQRSEDDRIGVVIDRRDQ